MQNNNLYTGLRSEFSRASRNLCTYAIPAEAWGKAGVSQWFDLSYEADGTSHHFPQEGSSEDRLNFLDRYLFEQMLPKEIEPRHRNDVPPMRADLNKYRGWLLNRVLGGVCDRAEDPFSLARRAYRLPEDFPKLIDDVYVFHCQSLNIGTDIAKFSTLNDLDAAVEPYRIHFPMGLSERAFAHAQYLEVDSEKLKTLLPKGWRVTNDSFIAPNGEYDWRDGGARLLAVLKDGTEIIHLRSEKASRAYGSPRWCTAYRREETAFDTYDDGLVVVIDPNGERWQLHFASMQFNDARDIPVGWPAIEARFPDLRPALKKYLSGILDEQAATGLTKYESGFMFCANVFPELRDEIDPELIKQAIKNTSARHLHGLNFVIGSEHDELPRLWQPHLTRNAIFLLRSLWLKEKSGKVTDHDNLAVMQIMADGFWYNRVAHQPGQPFPVSPPEFRDFLRAWSFVTDDGVKPSCGICGIDNAGLHAAFARLIDRQDHEVPKGTLGQIVDHALFGSGDDAGLNETQRNAMAGDLRGALLLRLIEAALPGSGETYKFNEAALLKLTAQLDSNSMFDLTRIPEGIAFFEKYDIYANQLPVTQSKALAKSELATVRLICQVNAWQHGYIGQVRGHDTDEVYEFIELAAKTDHLRKFVTPHLAEYTQEIIYANPEARDRLLDLIAVTPEWKVMLEENAELFALLKKGQFKDLPPLRSLDMSRNKADNRPSP